MTYVSTFAGACCAIALLALGTAVQADDRPVTGTYAREGHMEPAKSRYNRKRGVRVRGFMARRGGYYSYTDSDVINTYGGSRSLFGSTNSYRDPSLDRQTSSGPFDHGFFFDSGMGPRGGDAPYPR